MMDELKSRFYEIHRLLIFNRPTLRAGLLKTSPSRALLCHLIF